MKKSVLIVQPGGFGDIIMCLPIAKHYFDLGYKVIGPTRAKFKDIFRSIDYVKHLIIDDNNRDQQDWMRADFLKISEMFSSSSLSLDKALCLCDRRFSGEYDNLYGASFYTQDHEKESFIEFKYRVAGLNIKEAKLEGTRDTQKENELFEPYMNTEYSAIHRESSTEIVDFGVDGNVVELTPKKGYNVFDWYKVIQSAKAVYVVESAVHSFIEFSDVRSNKGNNFVKAGRANTADPFLGRYKQNGEVI